jgi:transcriptional regulator with XRE-family HTH domain
MGQVFELCRTVTLSEKLGAILKELRKEKKLSQEHLANKADLHRTYIGMIESGEKNVTVVKFLMLLKALDVKPEDFFSKYSDRLLTNNKRPNW